MKNEAGAMWLSEKKDKNGNDYYTGTINGRKARMFVNPWKHENQRAPDMKIVYADDIDRSQTKQAVEEQERNLYGDEWMKEHGETR